MDGLTFLAEHATPFALPLMSADAGRRQRKIAAGVDYLSWRYRSYPSPVPYPVGYIVGDRTNLCGKPASCSGDSAEPRGQPPKEYIV